MTSDDEITEAELQQRRILQSNERQEKHLQYIRSQLKELNETMNEILGEIE